MPVKHGTNYHQFWNYVFFLTMSTDHKKIFAVSKAASLHVVSQKYLYPVSKIAAC